MMMLSRQRILIVANHFLEAGFDFNGRVFAHADERRLSRPVVGLHLRG